MWRHHSVHLALLYVLHHVWILGGHVLKHEENNRISDFLQVCEQRARCWRLDTYR